MDRRRRDTGKAATSAYSFLYGYIEDALYAGKRVTTSIADAFPSLKTYLPTSLTTWKHAYHDFEVGTLFPIMTYYDFTHSKSWGGLHDLMRNPKTCPIFGAFMPSIPDATDTEELWVKVPNESYRIPWVCAQIACPLLQGAPALMEGFSLRPCALLR